MQTPRWVPRSEELFWLQSLYSNWLRLQDLQLNPWTLSCHWCGRDPPKRWFLCAECPCWTWRSRKQSRNNREGKVKTSPLRFKNVQIKTKLIVWRLINIFWKQQNKDNNPQLWTQSYNEIIFAVKFADTYLILMANSPASFCRTRKVPSDRDISRFLAAVLSMFPANLPEQRKTELKIALIYLISSKSTTLPSNKNFILMLK